MKSVVSNFALIMMLMFFMRFTDAQDFNQIPIPSNLVATGAHMIVYKENLYMVLREKNSYTNYYLYKYDGINLHHIPMPTGYKPESDQSFEIFDNKLFFMPNRQPLQPELLAYDGTTFSIIDIPYSPLVVISHYMKVYNGKLYFEMMNNGFASDDIFWGTYDGTDFTLIGVPSNYGIASGSIPSASYKIIYDGKLFCFFNDGNTQDRELVSFDGESFTTHSDPGGLSVGYGPGREIELYRNKLYFPVYDVDTVSMTPSGGAFYVFDGSNFSKLNIPSGLTSNGNRMEVFKGDLYFVFSNGLHSYDEISFTHHPYPVGFNNSYTELKKYKCKLYLSLLPDSSPTSPWWNREDQLFSFGNDGACGGYAVTSVFNAYETINISASERERDWCWTNIEVDFSISPICPIPPCSEPSPFFVSLTNMKGKVILREKFIKPFQLTLPGDDPYLMKLSVGRDDLVTFDENLIPLGIEEISLEAIPSQDYMELKVETQGGDKVPFLMSIFNSRGLMIYEEEFLAPLRQTLDINLKEQGSSIKFSPGAGNNIDLRAKGISLIKYYPNPTQGKLLIEIQTRGNKQIPVGVTLYDFNGFKLNEVETMAPFKDTISMDNLQDGLYLISVSVEGVTQTDIIQLAR